MFHYLDNAATTQTRPEAAQAAVTAMTEEWGNPSSRYAFGQEASGRLKEHRAQVAAGLGCRPEEVYFLSCGTEGDNWAIAAAVEKNRRKGKHIITTAIEHAAVLEPIRELERQGYEVTWLQPDQQGIIPAEQVEAALKKAPDIKTICITSPTYAGALSDIPAIAGVVHAHGGKLVVDGAHGAHLQFLGMDAYRGADAVVVSAHKTLPAMGQAALLFTNGIDPGQVRRTAAIYGTSSPSYPILASLDTAREWLEGPGAGEYGRVARRTAALRCRFPSLCPPLPLDPTRVTLKVKNGPAFTGQLESRCNIWPEMEDGGHVVFILTACDGEEVLDRLESVLEGMEEQMGDSAPLPPPPLPERVLSPRQAQFAPAEVLPLERTEGRVCTCQLAPYPPGVPVVAPGERIGKKELAYFRQIGYNNREVTVAAMP